MRQCSSRYRSSGPSEESRWAKFRACPKIQRPWPCLLTCVFGRFGRLSPSPLHSADALFNFRVKWWIHVSFIFLYRRKKSFLLRVNSFKERSESWIRYCFCSTVSKRGTHLEYKFFILKFSCITLNTVSFVIFRMSLKFCNFTFRSDKMIFRICFCVFGRRHLSWTTWALRVFGVCSTTFKICIPSANGCFRWGIFPVTLFKPWLSLTGIFTHQKTVFD